MKLTPDSIKPFPDPPRNLFQDSILAPSRTGSDLSSGMIGFSIAHIMFPKKSKILGFYLRPMNPTQ
jgi:hypothetical protein